jgi:hypothetical protein
MMMMGRGRVRRTGECEGMWWLFIERVLWSV